MNLKTIYLINISIFILDDNKLNLLQIDSIMGEFIVPNGLSASVDLALLKANRNKNCQHKAWNKFNKLILNIDKYEKFKEVI